ncbi:hypothetical protein SEA_DAUBENSKI_195 [Streptomyces phage Daubenski]|uniref:Uncharacterized protein n=1 Tax=Streptomyces phage Daubenski TaxID=2653725 RepID=A0A5Q2WDG5_9CAUD|nr:hypothetical protein KNU80_gp106 [Streptomyces phage Daubenski]QGH76466.1 hypothetical protein SEA_DAUBENSKI_195 [Streptomyces phage Daubenski]
MELDKVVDAAKLGGKVLLDTVELMLLTRSADEPQRKAAVAYMDAYKEQRGEVKTREEWQQFYNGVKKRLVV